MADWITWLVAAGSMLILEMFSGTFYLLMISIGLAAGGIAALSGADSALQYIVAALVGMIATVSLRRSKIGKNQVADAARDPNVNLDIGQIIDVNEWKTSAGHQSSARVMYRGAMWDVELAPGAQAQAGAFTISEIQGSRLIVTNRQ